MQSKDLFSNQARDYAKFRPTYPQDLFEYLASLTQTHDHAWDCATGNGQAAVRLAEYFTKVTGTDLSAAQLKNAAPHPHVTYRVEVAEKTGFHSRTIDLITVAQAFHWFNAELFFKEALRVLKPKGVLAIWSYNLAEITPEVDRVVKYFYSDILGPYWEKERLLVESGYRDVVLPMDEIHSHPTFSMKADWTLEHLVGYLGTWSALQAYIKKNGKNPLEEITSRLQSIWPKRKTLSVKWPLTLRVGREKGFKI